MKKIFGSGLVRPKASRSESQDSGADTPEANVARAIKAFCEAGKGKPAAPGPEGIDNDTQQVDEVTYLPVIVESAESSPAAAKEALYTIRKQLEYKNSKHGYQQYNALMLLRILSDNPGPSFTRNIDAKFVSTVKELYRGTKDPSVRQLLVENLEYFSKKDDPGLQPIKEWYVKEKESLLRAYPATQPLPRGTVGGYPGPIPGQPWTGSGHGSHRRPKNVLPPPEELAARISEAQTSAKLLLQMLQSTPTTEILGNQLITEFADRCSAASRSIQAFIEADSPPPDEGTMLTLFETNEQLATSLSRHQLAIFSAKQAAKKEGGLGDAGEQIPQIPPPPQSGVPSPLGTTIPIPENPGSRFSSGFKPSPSPPVEAKTYPPPPPPPRRQSLDDPFNDSHSALRSGSGSPQTGPYQSWRPEPIDGQQQQQYGAYNVSPIAPEPSEERHPMADVSPAAGQQVPHGYQPYRY
ncbi:hypothetical protein ABW19_dt0210595 [Dactylella cylindrospora]|nr:hypothetical protein ABW19_dt0210595 [Dactylella cylindrospora]